MGKITHVDAADMTTAHKVSETEWAANTTHLDSQGNALELSRSASLVVAASNSSAKAKAGADTICDGTNDEVEIKAALAAAGYADVLCSKGTYNINATITITGSSTVHQRLTFESGSTITRASDVNLFVLGLRAILDLTGVYVMASGSYTSNAITINHGSARLYGGYLRGGLGTGTGTAIKLASAGAAVIYNTVRDTEIYGFEYGIYPTSTDTMPTFANRFEAIRITYTHKPVYESKGTQSIHNNVYDIVYQYHDDYSAITAIYIAGSYNLIYLAEADHAASTNVLRFIAGAEYNRAILYGVTTENDYLDQGNFNRISMYDSREYLYYLRGSASGARIQTHKAYSAALTLQAVNAAGTWDNVASLVSAEAGVGQAWIELTKARVGNVAALPGASVYYRSQIRVVEGAAGVADTFHICMKAADNTYSWVQIKP